MSETAQAQFEIEKLTNDMDRHQFIGAFPEGEIFENKYKIEKKLGTGGMGVVYRAIHVFTERRVAIKFLHANLVDDDITVKRFKREALSVGRIKNDHVAAIIDFGVSDTNIFYLVMEYLEGENLRDFLRANGNLSLSATARIISQVCIAVEAAHKRNIIHRDLKPDNVFLNMESDGSETVKVLDFGIAKLTHTGNATAGLTETGMIVGTPYYMSPEQCQSDNLDPCADIYSIGVILFEMLTGHLPFTGDSPLSIALKHVSEPVPSLSKYVDDIPKKVEAVIMRAMAKKRQDRQQSAMGIAEEFAEAVKSTQKQEEERQIPTLLLTDIDTIKINSQNSPALQPTKVVEKTTASIWKTKILQVKSWLRHNRRHSKRKYLDEPAKVTIGWKDENGKTLKSPALIYNVSTHGLLLKVADSLPFPIDIQGDFLAVTGDFWSYKTIVMRVVLKDEYWCIGVQTISNVAADLFS